MNSVIYSNIFSDILQCRLRWGGLKPKGRSIHLMAINNRSVAF